MWKDSTEININLNVSSINLKSPLLTFSWHVASHTETGNPLWAHWLREYLTFCRVSYPVALLAASCFFIELIRLKYQSSSNSDLQRDYYKIRAHTHLPLHTHLFRCCKWIWMCLLISLCPPPPPAAGPHGGYFYLVLKYPSAEANMEGDSRMTCYTTASSSSMSYAHCPVVSLQARYMSIKALHLRLCGHRFFFVCVYDANQIQEACQPGWPTFKPNVFYSKLIPTAAFKQLILRSQRMFNAAWQMCCQYLVCTRTWIMWMFEISPEGFCYFQFQHQTWHWKAIGSTFNPADIGY